MRKVKLLIAVLVCSVMMMGVGYAWWQDSITVATTVNTGDLNMEFMDGSRIIEQSGYITGSFEFEEEVITETVIERKLKCGRGCNKGHNHNHSGRCHIHDDSCYGEVEKTVYNTVDTKKVLECTLNNLYPGASVDLRIPVKNAGSIGAYFDKVTITDVAGDAIGNLQCELIPEEGILQKLNLMAQKISKCALQLQMEKGITMIPKTVQLPSSSISSGNNLMTEQIINLHNNNTNSLYPLPQCDIVRMGDGV